MSFDQKKYVQFKSKLTRAINSKDPEKVLTEVKAFEDYYKQSKDGIPDDWARWQRAADDATVKLKRGYGFRPLF